MFQQLENADRVRREVALRIARERKAALGQFMTPSGVARFMASLFPDCALPVCRLLDAGAGVGALSCAFLDRWGGGGFGFRSVEVTAYEVDADLRDHLERHLAGYPHVTPRIIAGDYVLLAASEDGLAVGPGGARGGYTHAILNPPYRKIGSRSAHRLALRAAGIETVNLYSAFVALAVAGGAPGGQIVAIIPRSFCNGPYYRPFRDFILERAAIHHIHLFRSRSKAFRDDDVLQETVIIRLECGGAQEAVTVTVSTDDGFADLERHEYPFEQIVLPGDAARFIHIPHITVMPGRREARLPPAVRCTLADLGLMVSTGPVVDFRLRAHLRDMPEPGTVPLLYPGHVSAGGVLWPVACLGKPNAIARHAETDRWLYPNGFYCVVRRFSSKEERRRVVAGVVTPETFGEAPVLGFENHLNLFHENRRGLDERLARGLAVFLNTSAVDAYFRRFNGHTQVNATDLRQMRYPCREVLMRLGGWAMRRGTLTQGEMDAALAALGA